MAGLHPRRVAVVNAVHVVAMALIAYALSDAGQHHRYGWVVVFAAAAVGCCVSFAYLAWLNNHS